MNLIKSLKKTDLEKRYNVSRSTFAKMLKQVPGLVLSRSWYIHPAELKKILEHFG